MTRQYLSFDSVARAAEDRWPDILPGLGVEAKSLRRRHGPCPGCGGRDRFRFDDRDGRGTFVCGNGGGPVIAGDGFELLRHVHGWSRPEALERVASFLGMIGHAEVRPAAATPRREAWRAAEEAEREARRRAAQINRLWIEAGPICQGDPVARYLEARGLRLTAFPAAIRRHPALTYWHEVGGAPRALGSFPAMLALITDPSGRWVGLHRTYLNDAGGKATVIDPETGESLPAKKMLSAAPGACTGAAVHLGSGQQLVVAEGIETALAAAMLSERPAWACLSAHGLESLEVPPGIADVLIAADNDANEAGQNAAKALAARLLAQGVVVRMKWPEQAGSDWLDVLNSREVSA